MPDKCPVFQSDHLPILVRWLIFQGALWLTFRAASTTLGLNEVCAWSDSSGGVGIIRDSKKICPVKSDWSVGKSVGFLSERRNHASLWFTSDTSHQYFRRVIRLECVRLVGLPSSESLVFNFPVAIHWWLWRLCVMRREYGPAAWIQARSPNTFMRRARKLVIIMYVRPSITTGTIPTIRIRCSTSRFPNRLVRHKRFS